jgi:hypothetical protein
LKRVVKNESDPQVSPADRFFNSRSGFRVPTRWVEPGGAIYPIAGHGVCGNEETGSKGWTNRFPAIFSAAFCRFS